MLTFICLFLVLKHFFFDKVKAFMDKREANVQKQLDDARVANEEADARLAEYEDVVSKAEEKGREILKESKKMAEERADAIVSGAKSQAQEIVQNAEKKAEQERAKAVSDMKNDIAQIAVMAASQIVGKEIKDNGEEVIIDKIIEEAGAGKWQN
ncbi:MAG: F0F1 ATP synthase subunit B [Clostridia bacterium]|nr:F0F1 ATP synthase subunit B [Clostridia bacterium]